MTGPVTSMRWNDDPQASRSAWALVVNFVNARGGEARYEPEYVDHNGPQTPARIVIRGRDGKDIYCEPGQTVVMGGWFDPGNGVGFDGLREFTVTS